MRRLTGTLLAALLTLVFFADAVDVDVLVADTVNRLFHTHLNSIVRDELTGHRNADVDKSTHSIANLSSIPQDEDSPTTLDTCFPAIHAAVYRVGVPLASTEASAVRHNYLTLRVLLL